jgi:hypothetical protein
MPSYRLNLTIDEEFAIILQYFKSIYPLSSDVDIIRMALGQQFVQSRSQNKQAWENSIPTLELGKHQLDNLQSSLQNFESSKKIKFNNADDLEEFLNK